MPIVRGPFRMRRRARLFNELIFLMLPLLLFHHSGAVSSCNFRFHSFVVTLLLLPLHLQPLQLTLLFSLIIEIFLFLQS